MTTPAAGTHIKPWFYSVKEGVLRIMSIQDDPGARLAAAPALTGCWFARRELVDPNDDQMYRVMLDWITEADPEGIASAERLLPRACTAEHDEAQPCAPAPIWGTPLAASRRPPREKDWSSAYAQVAASVVGAKDHDAKPFLDVVVADVDARRAVVTCASCWTLLLNGNPHVPGRPIADVDARALRAAGLTERERSARRSRARWKAREAALDEFDARIVAAGQRPGLMNLEDLPVDLREDLLTSWSLLREGLCYCLEVGNEAWSLVPWWQVAVATLPAERIVMRARVEDAVDFHRVLTRAMTLPLQG